MIRSASGTDSLPSECMKSYWVSTSQKMTRAMAGNLSEDAGTCQQARRTDAQTHRREQRERTGIRCLTSVFPGASVRLAVPVLTAEALLLLHRNSSVAGTAHSPPTP